MYLQKTTIINQIDLLDKLNYTNIYQLPKLKTVTTKTSLQNNNLAELFLVSELFTGQKGILIKSKKHLAAFKLKKDKYVSISTTLRNRNLNNFLLNYILFLYNRNAIHIKHNQITKNILNISVISIKASHIVNEEAVTKLQNNYGFDISFIFNNKIRKCEIILFLSANGIYVK